MKLIKQIVEKFGLFQKNSEEGNIYWLLQQSGGENALGLPNTDCPYRIKSPLLMCPHNYNIKVKADYNLMFTYKKMLELSEVLQFFDPAYINKFNHNSIYLEASDSKTQMALLKLSLLCNPTIDNIRNVTSVSTAEMNSIIKRGTSSNLISTLVYGCTSEHLTRINILSGNFSTSQAGKLCFIGDRIPVYNNYIKYYANIKELIEYLQSLTDEQIRTIGCMRLKEVMRHV